MTTDESHNGTTEWSPLGRRSYLKVAASAAAAGFIGAGSAAADEDFDVIEVPAGQTETIQLGDGDTLENTVIDITADGAEYQINANGNGWEVRNVGVRGVWDGSAKAEPFIASVPSANGSARVENLYLGDGAHDDTYPGATGIYVANGHAGVLEIDRANIQSFPDNAIYGSSPGDTSGHSNGPGGGGEVRITNSYAADCRAGGFRVGTDGSYAENCVAVGCDRNYWGFYNDTEVIDCDFSNGQNGDIGTGDGHWQDDATVTVTNTRFESTVEHSGRVVGESDGTPQRTEPDEVEGVPLSATEAASGSSSAPDQPDDGSDDDNEDEEGNENGGDGHLLSFVTEPDARYAGYEFTAEGPVEFAEAPSETPSGGTIEGGTYVAEDYIEEDEDEETWHAGGVTGGGQGDAFRVDGAVTSIDVEQSDVMWLELDGEQLSPEQIIEQTGGDPGEDDEGDEGDEDDEQDDADDLSNVILIDATDTSDETSYSFAVTGEIEHSPYLGSETGEIDGATVEGTIENSCDAYQFSGEITDFWLVGNADVDVEYDVQ